MKIKELEKALEGAKDIKEALDIKKKWNNKHLIPLQASLGKASQEEKKEIGRELNVLKKDSDEIFDRVKEKLISLQKNIGIPKLDLSICNTDLSSESFNPLSEIRTSLINLFHSLNFSIESGKEIVSTIENFENLKIPKNHPSRSPKETFYIDEHQILRPHCTVHSINCLRNSINKQEPLKIATIGSVYRRDDETSRHTHQFNQLDFLWLQKGLKVSNLKYLLILIFESLLGKDKEYRLRNSYFPFTQPSVEIDMKCNCNHSEDCTVCGGSGWVEILGAGLFRRDILNDSGYSEEYECLAGGLGLERIALLKYRIEDIRNLYGNNFDFLNNDNK